MAYCGIIFCLFGRCQSKSGNVTHEKFRLKPLFFLSEGVTLLIMPDACKIKTDMKQSINFFSRVLVALMLCGGVMVTGCYDDSDIQNKLRDQQAQIDALKTLCAQQNTNLEALQTIVSALQERDYVTGVAPIKEGENVVGYTIIFSKSGAVTIHNGKDVYVPAMGVRQDEDSQWYWTVDGQWMTDADGNKVSASAQDGESDTAGAIPSLKIVDGYWYVSYDGGKTWKGQTLGQATNVKGYSMFEKVEYDDWYLHITLADGEVLTLPRTPEAGEDAITNTFAGVTLTVSLRNLTESGVSFYGEVKFEENHTANSCGILFSEQETLADATSIQIVDIYGTNYSVSTSSLHQNTTYYYTSYIRQGDDYKYGEVKSFTTTSFIAPTLNEALEVTEASAIISGTVIEPVGKSSYICMYGFQYSTSMDFSSDVHFKEITDIDSENKFSMRIAPLVPKTTYYYRSFIGNSFDNMYDRSETKSFTTEDLPNLKLEDIKTEVDVMSVTISGKIVGLENVDMSKVSLVLCGEYNQYDYQCKADQISENGEFRLVLDMNCKESLAHNSEYRCDLRLLYDSYMTDEESISIHTYIPKGSVNISSVSHDSAEFTGVIDDFAQISQCPSNTTDGKIQVGIYYSTDPNVELSRAKKVQGTLNDDGTFTVALTGLIPLTRYYYGLVIAHRSFLYGEIQEFTTSKYVDFSEAGTANSYIVSEAGVYKYGTVKGNSRDSVGDVASAEILWESFGTDVAPSVGDLIKSVSYADGYIVFQTADTFKEGNAVIAVKDASGNILWSWHIWLTDQPQGQEYYNNAGTMMDRNLGATSATPGDVGALGLLYQWGRKDPFLGSSSISGSTLANSTITWPSPVSSDSNNGTIEYATAHPTTFITKGNHFDWYYTDSSSTDNPRWTTSGFDKSIYDPCPSGWRVPDGGSSGVWSKASNASSYYFNYTYDSTNKGINFSGKFGNDQVIWYPVSGYRYSNSGSLLSVGSDGYYWSVIPDSSEARHMYLYNGYVYPSENGHSCAHGYAVRCVREID